MRNTGVELNPDPNRNTSDNPRPHLHFRVNQVHSAFCQNPDHAA